MTRRYVPGERQTPIDHARCAASVPPYGRGKMSQCPRKRGYGYGGEWCEKHSDGEQENQ